MRAQILSAGPSLMFMVVMRWSSFSSIKAWPSISWRLNSSAYTQHPGKSWMNCSTSLTCETTTQQLMMEHMVPCSVSAKTMVVSVFSLQWCYKHINVIHPHKKNMTFVPPKRTSVKSIMHILHKRTNNIFLGQVPSMLWFRQKCLMYNIIIFQCLFSSINNLELKV